MSDSQGRPVRMEVIRIMGTGRCSAGLQSVGQSRVVSDSVVPQGMCGYAYNAISPFVTALRFGGRPPWRDDAVMTVCCPDADNPVVFELGIEA